MIKNKAGVWGEIYTVRYLRDRGYKIISSNYVCRFGELDAVAMKDGVLCFVEVKTRNELTQSRPMEAVDEAKQERVRLAANSFISYSKLNNPIRFDVSEVYLDDDYKCRSVNYIKNAFE